MRTHIIHRTRNAQIQQTKHTDTNATRARTDRKCLALLASKALPDHVQPRPEVKGMSRKAGSVPLTAAGSSSSTCGVFLCFVANVCGV